MKTINEITLTWAPGTTEFMVHEGSKVLFAEYDRDKIKLTIESDKSKEPVPCQFRPFAIGDEVPDQWYYVATVKERGMQLHIYRNDN